MRDLLIMVVGILLVCSPIFANNNNPTEPETEPNQDVVTEMPKVFVLGSHETAYDKLSEEYSTSLLQASNDDSAIAGSLWRSLIKEMEAHAEMVDYDIKGVKMWLHVFWDDKGKINHIGYYLKPNSRNVKNEELTSFLTDFVNNYYVPASFEQKFSHYTQTAFPTMGWKRKNSVASKDKD